MNIQIERGLPHSRHCRLTRDHYIELLPDGKRMAYDIALSSLRESGGLARWIQQIAPKAWATPEVIADFATFVSDLLCCPPLGRAGRRYNAEK